MKHLSDLNQLKRLSSILFVSLTCNAALAVGLGYYFWVDRPPTPVCEHKPVSTKKSHPHLTVAIGAQDAIKALKKHPMIDLKEKLSDKRVVEMGYTVRDLSLGALAGFYQLDIEKALKKPIEEKWLQYGSEGETLAVYPGLSDEDFNHILSFMETEKWPFKTEGLFKLLKSEKWKGDASLEDAFFLTPEFLTFENIFSPAKIDRKTLLDLVLSGDYGKLKGYHERHKALHEISDSERRLILLDYLNGASLISAQLLLKGDYEFTLKKLNDDQTIQILTLFKDKTADSEKFAKALLESPRSDRVRRVAVERLYEYAGNPLPQEFDLKKAIEAKLPQVAKTNITPVKPTIPSVKTSVGAIQKAPPKMAPKLPLKKEKIYIVQNNETLWSVAKKFKVDVNVIKKMNAIDTEKLKPGTALRIPIPAAQAVSSVSSVAPGQNPQGSKDRTLKAASKSKKSP